MMVQEVVAVALLVAAFLFQEVAAQLGVLSSACTTDADCGPGLYCFSCEGAAPKCTADQALPVSSFAKTYSLPYNKYAWITTHNAYALQGEQSILGSVIISPTNQEDTVTNQLNRGVRGLMLDIYEFLGDLWLCHSIGTCFDFTAFRPLNGTLLEIAAFLAANPTEVITIFIEDYVTTPYALTNHFTAAGLTNYMFPLASMPTDGSDWPPVASMIASNQRFVVFTSDRKKEVSEGIAYQWNYVVENQYGTLAETCTNRAESSVLTDRTKSLILENYFPDNPNITEACVINSGYLAQAITVCYAAAGNRWSNFLAVDFYKRSTAGGVFSAVDTLNGHLQCGCNDIRLCQASGSCQAPDATHKAVQTPAPGPRSAAPAPPVPESSSACITNIKFSVFLPFFISFISFFLHT